MTNAELISMVRSIAKHGADWRINEVLNRAADALEAAEKRIAELEAQEPTEEQVVDYCRKRYLVIITGELFQRMKATFSLLPKEGEWIESNTRPRSAQFCCSVCHRTCYDIQPTRDKAWTKRCRYNYCPNCGARMDGKEKTDADS